MKTGGWVVIFFVILALLSEIGRVIAANQLVSYGLPLQIIEEKISTLKHENLILRDKIFENSSFYTIGKRAREQGFTTEDTIYIP